MSSKTQRGFAPSKILILASTLLLPFTRAQQAQVLIPSQIPACALQCPILLAAQEQCVPPFRPTTNQQVYNACFCNSDYLTAFKNGQTAGFCQGICDEEDMSTLLTWFRGTVCTNANPTPVNNAAQGTTTAGVAPGAVTTRTITAGQTTGTAAATTQNRSSTGRGPSWISTHYGWVIMIVVLVVAATLAVILGCWWRKRRQRRHLQDPAYRSSMIVANEAAVSLRNKHPVASPPMGQSSRVPSTQSVPTMAQRQSMSNRPPSASWQGGAAGVGAAGIGAAGAAGPAAVIAASNRQSSSSIQRENMGVRSRSDFSMSPTSTPGALERDGDTPLSMSDRPLLESLPPREAPSPAATRQPSGRLQKSQSSRRRGTGPSSPIGDDNSITTRPATAR